MDEQFKLDSSQQQNQTDPKTQTPYKQEVQDIFSDTETFEPAMSQNIPPQGPGPNQISSRTYQQTQPSIARSGGLSRKSIILIAGGLVALLAIVGGIFLLLNLIERLPKNVTDTSSDAQKVVQPTNTGPSEEQVNNQDQNNATQNTGQGQPVAPLDTDKDGLTDEEEVANNSNPNQPDSDNDALSDYDEVQIYKTKPNNSDTDGDGYLDGEEVQTGHNPNGPGFMNQVP